MKMEVVLSSPGHGHYDDDNTPYKNEEIHEWSGVDKITGMLETARIETGRWRAFDDNSAKSYGKVTDLRERNSADGSIVQKARRQVEIYQSKEPGRSVQVVRASHWSSSRMTDTKEFIFSKKLTPWNNPKLGEYSKTTIKSPSNTRKNILSQKRCNSNEDLSVLTDSSTSKNDFIRNLQTRRSLQIPTTSKNSTDTAKRITRNDKIDENKINDETMENKNESDDNDDKIYTKISSAITGNKSSSITINTPTVKTIKKPQITVINLIDSSSNYSDNNNKKNQVLLL